MRGERNISSDRSTQVKALVLAAGVGSRIRSLHPDVPKPLIDVGGVSILQRNLEMLARYGIEEAWINLHYQGERIEFALASHRQARPILRFSREPRLLGTAGAAVKLRQELSGGRFFIVYGDNLTSTDLDAMTAAHIASGAAATIAVFDPERIPNSGIAGGRVSTTTDGSIIGFEEKSSATGLVNAGVYLLEPGVFDFIPDGGPSDFGRDVFPRMIAAGARLHAFPLSGYCLAFDTPAAEARAREVVTELELERQSR